MRILVLVEHDEAVIKEGTWHTLNAAQELMKHDPKGMVDLVICGAACQSIVAEATHTAGVRSVLYFKHPALQHQTPEAITQVLQEIARDYTHILAPASTFGKNTLPRLAALLDVMQISDAMAIHGPDIFDRPIYAGNAIQTVQSHDPIKILTIRTTAFSGAHTESEQPAALTENTPTLSEPRAWVKGKEVSESLRPDLVSARVVVAGGRGLGSAENFQLLETLADQLNAAIGASRAAVDAGYVPNDYQVGQTGKIVAPELYVAIGISGAIQHIAGMKESRVIVAINKDPEAPIFQIADYGYVGDLFQVVPELIARLESTSLRESVS